MTLVRAGSLADDADKLSALLPAARKARMEAYKTESDRLRCLAAGLLLLDAFGDVPFEKGPQGKPFLPGGAHFNLSHSGDWAVLAVADAELGVDIEKIRSVNIERLKRRTLRPEELSALERAEDPLRGFFTLWTRKESYMKCDGRGFSLPLNSFSVLGGVCRPAGCPPRYLRSLDAPEGYALSLCAEEDSAPVIDTIDFTVSPWRREAWSPRRA